MTETLAGQAAIVTGGGRGLGRAIALALARAGADVAVAGRSTAELANVADEIRSLGRHSVAVTADVTVPGDPERVVESALGELGRLDVLVNNSGVTLVAPALETSDGDFDRVFRTNVWGTFACCRAAGRHFVATNQGKIINIASHLGVVGRAQFAAYSASKAAVLGMTRSLALEWARYGVQVNAVAPGLVETDMNAELRADPEATARVIARVPARRMATPEEIASLVVYLASNATDYLTGQTIVVDGGETAG